jgi:hypothetical protein
MKWFNANLLSPDFDCMEFYHKDTTNSEKHIIYNNKIIYNATELKFLGYYSTIQCLG